MAAPIDWSIVQGESAASMQLRGWRGLIKRLRRATRHRLNAMLVRLGGGARHARRAPLARDTRRVLIVRLNKRLGNILFLTPMLRTLASGLPGAAIDVLIRDPRHRPLLENLPGVRRVWVQPRSPAAMLGLLHDLRRRRFDLAIDPSGNSASNRLGVLVCGARQRMGFAGSSQWLRLTHAAPRPASRHQAEQAVELLTGAVADVEFTPFQHLAVSPGEAARAQADDYWHRVFDQADAAPVIGFFTHATGAKRLDDDWWRAWLAAVRLEAPMARILQIHPPGMAVPLEPDLPGISIAELDVLAAVLARLHVFVAADAGPMHLSAAAGVPTIGLFNATSARAYAPLGPACTSLEAGALTPANAAREAAQHVTSRHVSCAR